MSYINSALKKVQEERDGRYGSYGDILSSPPKKPVRIRRRIFLVSAAAVVFLIILVLTVNGLYHATTRPVKAPAAVSKGSAVAQPAILPAKPKEAGEDRLLKTAKLYEEALAAQRGKRWEEAENLYKQILTFDPRHINSLNNLGVLYMGRGRFEEATELFVRATVIREDYVDPYYNLACLYSQTGKIKVSLGYLARAAKIDGRVREWAKGDPDFKKMRSLPEFKKITEE